MLSEQELLNIETRANAATPGPWEVDHGALPTVIIAHDPAYVSKRYNPTGRRCIAAAETGAMRADDRDFIAHARSDVPALLAEVRRQSKLIADNGFVDAGYRLLPRVAATRTGP